MNKKVIIVCVACVILIAVILAIVLIKPSKNEQNRIVEVAERNNYFPLEDICIYHDDAIISLPTNKAKGYEWSYEIKDKKIAVVTSEEYSEDITAADGIKVEIGADGYTTFKIELLKKGETQIIFTYLKNPNDENSVVETVVFDLSVNDNFQIAVVKEERF